MKSNVYIIIFYGPICLEGRGVSPWPLKPGVKSYQGINNNFIDASLLNTQHYYVRTKGKVEQSREISDALSLHLGAVEIEMGPWIF